MKKLIKILVVFLVIFTTTAVYADPDLTYRTKKDNRVIVKINGQDVYMSVQVLFNMTGDFAGAKAPVDNFSAEFKNGTFYITIKRSDLNKVFKNTKYDNVYSNFEVSADLLDFKSDKKYFYASQNDYQSKLGEDYTVTFDFRDYNYRNYKFIEIANSSVQLTGYVRSADGISSGGGFAVYEADDYPEIKEYPTKYNLSDLSSYKKIIGIDRRSFVVSIIEDVQMDLGDTKKIISESGTTDPTTGETKHDEIEVNNFYGQYYDNHKLQYSWTLYDSDGNPREIDINTLVTMDDSENEEKIIKSFKHEFDNIQDRVKIISFKHEGDLGGKARVSLYVGDKFKPGTLVTFLYWNPITEELENTDFSSGINDVPPEQYTVLVDEDGYVTMDITHCSEYVVTEEEVATKVLENKKEETKNETAKAEDKKDNKLFIIIGSAVAGLAVVATVVIVVIKKRKTKEEKTENVETPVVQGQPIVEDQVVEETKDEIE